MATSYPQDRSYAGSELKDMQTGKRKPLSRVEDVLQRVRSQEYKDMAQQMASSGGESGVDHGDAPHRSWERH